MLHRAQAKGIALSAKYSPSREELRFSHPADNAHGSCTLWGSSVLRLFELQRQLIQLIAPLAADLGGKLHRLFERQFGEQ